MSKKQTPEAEPRHFFDLESSDGINESERILTKLCRKSFLRLWSQSNIFTDEGFKGGKGSTKELCDALVVFGNDVIIFSDKNIKFQQDRDLGISWPRWYKRAVLDSCRQLYGAKSWLQRFPDRAFLEPKCERKLPIQVPRGDAVRFHLVAVTRGSREATLEANGGQGLGSFGVNTGLIGDDHLKTPFVIGLPEPAKQFVHVFDEVTIGLLLGELDTAVDFLYYLKERERLLGRPATQVCAFGEEDLMAAYLSTMDNTGEQHMFVNIPEGQSYPDVALFDGGWFDSLRQNPAYLRKKEADRVSYEWDALIERFVEYGDPDLHEYLPQQQPVEIEEGLRLLAAESRFRRRQLAESLVGALRKVAPGGRLGRLSFSGVAGDTVFIFVIVPKRDDESYREYREHRVSVLHAYCRTARLKAPLGTVFVGIGIDNPHKDYRGGSEDLVIFKKDSWTDAELVELEDRRQELGLWGPDMEFSRYRQDEFPQSNQGIAIVPVTKSAARHNASVELRQAEKRLRKMQQASKRRNRH